MTKADALARLREREAELRALGIDRLSIFGSTARGEEGPESDVDLAVILRSDLRIGAFGFIRMEGRISDMLGRRVDLITEPSDEEPRLQAQIDKDRVRFLSEPALAWNTSSRTAMGSSPTWSMSISPVSKQTPRRSTPLNVVSPGLPKP